MHSQSRYQTTPNRVLIIENDEQRAQPLLAVLEALKCVTLMAASVSDALKLRKSNCFDIVMFSAALPRAPQAIKKLRADHGFHDLPVIAYATPDEAARVAEVRMAGADSHLLAPFSAELAEATFQTALYHKVLEKNLDELLNRIIPIGMALLYEEDFNDLLELILGEAEAVGHADGGTLYLRTEDDALRFVVLHTHSLDIKFSEGKGTTSSFPPLHLYDPDTGQPNHHNVATHATLTASTVNIPDAYKAKGFDFSGTRRFDKMTGYHSTSFLTVPLKDASGEVIGVLQLINAQDPVTGDIVPFAPSLEPLTEALAALATVAMQAYIRQENLRKQIADLRIEIDEVRKQQNVSEIVETDYFKHLQDRARELRTHGSKQKRKKTGSPRGGHTAR